MKTRYLVAMAVALSVSSAAFAADDAAAMFKQSNCTTCHAPDKKMVGPSLKAIALKYAGNAEAQALLEKKVRAGGGGVWGSMPMPRTAAAVSDEKIKAIVEWILSTK